MCLDVHSYFFWTHQLVAIAITPNDWFVAFIKISKSSKFLLGNYILKRNKEKELGFMSSIIL